MVVDEAEVWGRLTCPALRKELKKRGLPTSGNKPFLIARLCGDHPDENNNPEQLPPVPVCSREEELRNLYGAMKICQLKEALKNKPNASTRGKKADLVERLVMYDLNSNFTVATNEEDLEDVNVLDLPSLETFKDIHAGCPLPHFTRQDVELYLARFHKAIGKADEMYNEGFLEFIRFSSSSDFTFLFGKCRAEMKKSNRYEVYCKLTKEGEVEGCTCECTHGRSSGEAHCKHVSIVLLGLVDMKKTGTIITELTCTQQLQTFHQPTKKFKGTPLKAYQLNVKSRKDGTLAPLPEYEETRENVIAYRTFFRNLLINGCYNSNIPLKHLIEPANPYGILNDHTYSTVTTADLILDRLHLRKISPEDISKIESETRGQSSSPMWHEIRETRLTASRMYEVIHDKKPASRAASILYPTRFVSRATNHGIKYESVAINKYEKENPGVEVKKSGIIIMESHPYIAASPDFLIGDYGVGEVKCPYTSRERPVGPKCQPYLRWSKDSKRMKLKKTHQYYYQVQGLLMVTGRLFCDFVIYTFKEMKIIRIHRKDNFITLNILFKLVSFYENYMLPAILNKYLHREYKNYKFALPCQCNYCCKIPVI